MREDNDRAYNRPGLSHQGKPSNANTQYIYHWDRIAIATALLLVLIAGAIYLTARLLSDEDAATPSNTVNEHVSAPLAETADSEASPPVAAQTTPQQPSHRMDRGATAGGVDQRPLPDDAPAKVATEEASRSALPEGTAAESPASSADDEIDKTPSASEAGQGEAPLPLANFAVETPSPAVVRARFAAAIRNKEPEGDPASIKANDQGLVRVYFFTEVKNRKGSRLAYRWLHNGKRVATVNAGAWNNAWRSYSSKFVTPAQQGKWRVELVDVDGKVLAVGSFDYLP